MKKIFEATVVFDADTNTNPRAGYPQEAIPYWEEINKVFTEIEDELDDKYDFNSPIEPKTVAEEKGYRYFLTENGSGFETPTHKVVREKFKTIIYEK